jgi:hypothetical protein
MMNRQPWLTDPKEIVEAIRALIEGQFPIMLQLKGSRPLQSRLLAIHSHRQTPYLLIARPPGLADVYQVRDLLFKLEGLPILGFSCPVTRASDTMLATMLPYALFSVELRQGMRMATPSGSMATFFVQGRSQVNICLMENISMGGVKLSGQPTHALGCKDMIGPCTLSLAGQDAVITREVTINRAAVVRVEQLDRKQLGFGLKFDLNGNEEQQLREHLDFLGQDKH